MVLFSSERLLVSLPAVLMGSEMVPLCLFRDATGMSQSGPERSTENLGHFKVSKRLCLLGHFWPISSFKREHFALMYLF